MNGGGGSPLRNQGVWEFLIHLIMCNTIINMSSELEQQEVSIKNIQRRRGRSDQQNRDYKCSCGKSYLSYPALYTHVKQKHPEDIEELLKKPGGINKPQTAELPRGRPKVIKETNEKEEENVEYSALSVTEILIVELVEIFKGMEEFKNKPMILIDNSVLSNEDVKEELQPFGLNVDYLLLNKSLPLPANPATMRQLVVYFVFILRKHFSAYVYSRLLVFFHIFLQAYEQKFPESQSINPMFFPEFIRELYERYRRRHGVEIWEERPKIVLKALGAFGSWMHVYRYINQKIQLN